MFKHSTNVKATHADQTLFHVLKVSEDVEAIHNEFRDEQSDLDFDAVNEFGDFLKHPDTPSKFNSERNLKYSLPENISFQICNIGNRSIYSIAYPEKQRLQHYPCVWQRHTVLLEYSAIP